jgi:AIPR protein
VMKTAKYSFAVEKACRSVKDGDKELWTVTVRLKHLPRNLKYGPNARYATLDTKPAKEMLRTLSADPETFVYKNNGLMVVAQGVKAEGSLVEMHCKEKDGDPADDENFIEHGVLNGGHTYRVLEHVLDSNDEQFAQAIETATVLITVAIGISQDDIAGISRARNTAQSVPLYALRNLAGDWSILKKYLPADVRKRVAFKPADPDANADAEYDTTDLVRRIALLNNDMFPAEQGVHPVPVDRIAGNEVQARKLHQARAAAP